MLRTIAATLLSTVLIEATLGQTFVEAARSATAATPEGSPARLKALLAEAKALLRYDLAEAEATAGKAAQLADTLSDEAALAHALAVQARTAAGRLAADVARNTADAAIQALPHDAPPGTQAYAWLAKALVHFTVDDMMDCLTALQRAVDFAEEAGDADSLVKATILSVSAMGWGDNAAEAAQALLVKAKANCTPPIVLEARIMCAVAQRGLGQAGQFESELQILLAEAARVGDRASTGFLQASLARVYAPEDLERSRQFATKALASHRAWGDREHIGRDLHYLAKLAVHRQQLRVARTLIEQALASLEDLGALDTTAEVLETAVHIASIAGLPEAARRYGERHDAITRILTQRQTRDFRSRFWRQANTLNQRLRDLRSRHQEEVAVLDAQLRSALLIGGGALFTLLLGASVLQLRSHRRIRRANEELQTALQSSQALQEERITLQQNLQQLERLDSIGLLAGGFAHDFNNILVGVRGNAQLLQMDDNLSADQQQMVAQIVQASDRAAGLCKDILAYAHAAPTPTDVVDLRDVIAGLIPLAQAGFGSGIEVDCDLGEQPALIDADRSQIEQVFLNLLVNAGDAITDHGRIRISIDEAHLGGQPPSGNWFGEFPDAPRDCIAVTVLDNGHGIEADKIRRIFDPFFSTHVANRGIGLATVFGILRRHKGVVEVQSEVGRGTQFTVYLPKSTVASETDQVESTVVLPQMPPRPRTPTHTTVLVVDDEEPVRKVVKHALIEAGYEVLLAPGGMEAIQLLEQHGDHVTIALVDMTMPSMDGTELARRLRQRYPGLRIVFMTGHAQRVAQSEDLDMPLIGKPFDLNALLDVLASAQGSPDHA